MEIQYYEEIGQDYENYYTGILTGLPKRKPDKFSNEELRELDDQIRYYFNDPVWSLSTNDALYDMQQQYLKEINELDRECNDLDTEIERHEEYLKSDYILPELRNGYINGLKLKRIQYWKKT